MMSNCAHKIDAMNTRQSILFKDGLGYRFLLTVCFRQKIQWTMTHCELRCLHVDSVRNHFIHLN